MEIRQLRYFVQMATDQNFTTAAKKLYVSQPTLSWTLKQLEEELGVKLFIQQGKKLALSFEGEELLIKAKILLAQHQQILELFQNRRQILSGHIHLGIPALFGTYFFMQPMMNFMECYPKIKVTMHNAGSTAIQELVAAGKVDIGVVSYPTPNPELDAIPLPNITYPIVLVVNIHHRLATRSDVSFADLREESFILLGEGYTVGTLPVEACKKAGFTPNIVLRSSEWNVICEAVATSNTITILPQPFMEKIHNPNLAFIPLSSAEAAMPVAIVTKNGKPQTDVVKKFIQFLLDDILNNNF